MTDDDKHERNRDRQYRRGIEEGKQNIYNPPEVGWLGGTEKERDEKQSYDEGYGTGRKLR